MTSAVFWNRLFPGFFARTEDKDDIDSKCRGPRGFLVMEFCVLQRCLKQTCHRGSTITNMRSDDVVL